MSYKPYSARRWTDIPKPIRTGEKKEFTEEEKQYYDEVFERILKKYGVLKEGESLKHT